MSQQVFDFELEKFWSYVKFDNSYRRIGIDYTFMNALNLTDCGPQTNLCLVGSDGKEERYPQSKTEVVILKRPSEPSIREVLTKSLDLDKFHLEIAYDGMFGEYNIPETEELPEVPLSYQYGDPKKVYPDFLLNSLPLMDNPTCPSLETHAQMRAHVLREMGDDGPIGKGIRKVLLKQLSSYRQGIDTGEYYGVKVYDKENIYYDEGDPTNYGEASRKKNFGIKVPFLRSVQRKLDIVTANFIKSNNDSELIKDLSILLPTSTPEKLTFFSDFNVLSPIQSTLLREAYIYYLKQQHICQALFKKERALISIPVETKEFNYYRNIIKDFVKPQEI